VPVRTTLESRWLLVELVEVLFDVLGNLALDLKLIDCLLGSCKGLADHVFVHVCDLNEAFVDLSHESYIDLKIKFHK
jgi:hypothetical protein